MHYILGDRQYFKLLLLYWLLLVTADTQPRNSEEYWTFDEQCSPAIYIPLELGGENY